MLNIIIVMFVFLSQAFAVPAAQPIAKIGSNCPSNYSSNGAYCNPNSSAMFAIAKIGSNCPSNYSSNGAYCVATSSSTKLAIPKVGSNCPSGYSSNGAYCLQN